jgi:hypothetical protein
MYDNKKNINQTHLKMPMLNMNNVPSVENNSGVEENHAKKRLVFKLKKENVNNNMIVPSRNEIEAEKDDCTDDKGKNILLININNYNQTSTNETSDTDVPAPAPSVAMITKPKIGLKKMPKSEESAKVQCNETNDRDKLNEYYYRHREQKLEYQKKYNKERGDIIKDYNKDYYMKQREKILAKAKTKVMCECGCEVQLFNMNCHKKTKKHLRLVEAKVALLAASASTDAIASN